MGFAVVLVCTWNSDIAWALGNTAPAACNLSEGTRLYVVLDLGSTLSWFTGVDGEGGTPWREFTCSRSVLLSENVDGQEEHGKD